MPTVSDLKARYLALEPAQPGDDPASIEAAARAEPDSLGAPRVARWLAELGAEHGDLGTAGAGDEPCPLPAVERAVHTFGLTSFERDVITVALACELDDRYAAIIGMLDGRPPGAWPTVGAMLRLFESRIAAARVSALAALGPHGRLVELGSST